MTDEDEESAGSPAEPNHITDGQLESFRRICRRLATIGSAPFPEKVDTVDDLILGLSSLTEVCARRLKNKHDDTELRLIRDEVEDIERMKSRFIRNVSHELRTPLASIDGFARALLKMETVGPTESNPELVSPEIRRQFLTIVSQEAQRLGKLIEDVLDISDIEQTGSRRTPEVFSAKALFDDVLKTLATANTPTTMDVQIRLSPEPDGPTLYADRQAMIEVLRHLLNNAQKFSAGQTVILGAELVNITPDHSHPASATDSGHRARVSTATRIYVRDKGIGIPKDELDNIFQKFYKVEHTGATFPGTGLGLSIVRALVNQNNGQVWASSELGKGSTLYVLMPSQAG